MKRRKPNNPRARLERSCRAILSSNHVAVVSISPSGWQGMVNWKLAKRIPPGRQVANALCDIPHRWTIYVAGLCVDWSGNRYMKSIEAMPDGNYLAAHLTDVIETCVLEQRANCNPRDLIGSGWIAIPAQVSLTEEQAYRIFDLVGAWNQVQQVSA
ncbi:hypothetical protein VLF92_03075 [Pseudomonas chengduensis]